MGTPEVVCSTALRGLVEAWTRFDMQGMSAPVRVARRTIRKSNKETMDLLSSLPGVGFRVIPKSERKERGWTTAYEWELNAGNVEGQSAETGHLIAIEHAPRSTHRVPHDLALTHREFGEVLQDLFEKKYAVVIDPTAPLLGIGGQYDGENKIVTLEPHAPMRSLVHEVSHQNFTDSGGYALVAELKRRLEAGQNTSSLFTDPRAVQLGGRRFLIVAELGERGVPPLAIDEILAGQSELDLYGKTKPPPRIVRGVRDYTISYVASELIAKQGALTARQVGALADAVHEILKAPDLVSGFVEPGARFLEGYNGEVRPLRFPAPGAEPQVHNGPPAPKPPPVVLSPAPLGVPLVALLPPQPGHGGEGRRGDPLTGDSVQPRGRSTGKWVRDIGLVVVGGKIVLVLLEQWLNYEDDGPEEQKSP